MAIFDETTASYTFPWFWNFHVVLTFFNPCISTTRPAASVSEWWSWTNLCTCTMVMMHVQKTEKSTIVGFKRCGYQNLFQEHRTIIFKRKQSLSLFLVLKKKLNHFCKKRSRVDSKRALNSTRLRNTSGYKYVLKNTQCKEHFTYIFLLNNQPQLSLCRARAMYSIQCNKITNRK